jgi:GTP cyclohydrolase I
VRDKARAVQNTVATIGMFVDLPKEFKGTHMSRFIEVLNAHGTIVHVENIPDILYAMQKKFQRRRRTWNGISLFHVKTAPVSRMESMMDYVARFEATACQRRSISS